MIAKTDDFSHLTEKNSQGAQKHIYIVSVLKGKRLDSRV